MIDFGTYQNNVAMLLQSVHVMHAKNSFKRERGDGMLMTHLQVISHASLE